MEAPEPSYTAETLMRRSSGVGVGILGAAVNWLLLGAAERGRSGASTFVQLNGTLGIVNIAVRTFTTLAVYCVNRGYMPV